MLLTAEQQHRLAETYIAVLVFRKFFFSHLAGGYFGLYLG